MSASLSKWNQWLLAHYFTRGSRDASPVTQILVTHEELARACEDDMTPVEAAESLLSELKNRVRAGMRPGAKPVSFIRHAQELENADGFLSHLVVTCLVASSCDSDTVEIGDYRARLRAMLGDVATDNLGALPDLWDRLARWLEAENRRGRRLRHLKLPGVRTFGPGSQIGISVGLAFPGRRDQQRLIETLREADLMAREPPVYIVTELLTQKAKKFSARFQNALGEFKAQRDELRTEQDGELLAATPFWSAVRQAAMQEHTIAGAATLRRARWDLFCQPNDYGELMVYLATDSDHLPDEMQERGFIARAEELDDQFSHLVTMLESAFAATDGPVKAVLGSEVVLPGTRRLIEEGVLLFDADAFGPSRLFRARPEAGKHYALVREERLSLAEASGGEVSASRRYPGWSEVRGFDPARAASGGLSESELPGCLQRVARPKFLKLEHSYVRLHGDVLLGFRDVLPGFRLSSTTAMRASGTAGSFKLERADDDVWRFSKKDVVDDLEGACEVVAYGEDAEGQELRLSSIQLEFRLATSLCMDYGRPPRPDEWRLEAGSSLHRRPTQTLADEAGLAPARRFVLDAWLPSASLFLGPRVGDVSEERRPGFDWEIVEIEPNVFTISFCGDAALRTPPAAVRAKRRGDSDRNIRWWRKRINTAGSDDLANGDRRHLQDYRDSSRRSAAFDMEYSDLAAIPVKGRLRAKWRRSRWSDSGAGRDRVEVILAGRFRSAGGVPRAAILELLERELALPRAARLVWDVYRSWVEAGCWDDCIKLSWRDSRAFGIDPHFLMHEARGKCHATLIGLSTASFRQEILNAAERLGIDAAVERPARSTWEPRTLDLVARPTQIGELSVEVGMEAPRWVRSIEDTVVAVADVLTSCPPPPPPGGHECIRGWDWHLGGFVPNPPAATDRPTIDCLDRPDRPWHFQVAAGQDRHAWTYSRNWAILLAYHMDDSPAFAPSGDLRVVRTAPGSFHLPLAWARLAHVLGGSTPGLRPDSGSSAATYTYEWPSQRLRDHVMSHLAPKE